MRVLLGNPDGTFQPALTSATGSVVPPKSLAVGDFNDDGLLDLATGNGHDNSYGPFDVSVLMGIDGTAGAPGSSRRRRSCPLLNCRIPWPWGTSTTTVISTRDGWVYYGVTGSRYMSCWATAPGGLSAIFHVARR